MTHHGWRILALSIAFVMTSGPVGLVGQVKTKAEERPPGKILVELFTSQGCSSCPPASDFLGRLAKLGYGPDRVILLNFHVDYFNNPWVDPYSLPAAHARQVDYNEALGRDDLTFTPLMMVDGRYPLVGSNQSAALKALANAGQPRAEVALDLALEGKSLQRSLSIQIDSRDQKVVGRELLVGVALAEDPVTTRVTSGENAGRTLHERQVVRRFVSKAIILNGSTRQTLKVPIELARDWKAERFRVTVFVQDRATGAIYQAESIPWVSSEEGRELHASKEKHKVAHAKGKRANAMNHGNLFPRVGTGTGSSDDPTSCPDCGTPLTVDYLSRLPAGFTFARRYKFLKVPPPEC